MENKRYILQELCDSGFCYYGILDTKNSEIVYITNNYADVMEELKMKNASPMQELIALFKEGKGGKSFDFMANNYHLFTKDELAQITKELIYAIYDKGMKDSYIYQDCEQMFQNAAEELEDYYA